MSTAACSGVFESRHNSISENGGIWNFQKPTAKPQKIGSRNVCETPTSFEPFMEGFWHDLRICKGLDDRTITGFSVRCAAPSWGKEKISGASIKRPQLQRLIEQLRDDDIVVVTKYDRLPTAGPEPILLPGRPGDYHVFSCNLYRKPPNSSLEPGIGLGVRSR